MQYAECELAHAGRTGHKAAQMRPQTGAQGNWLSQQTRAGTTFAARAVAVSLRLTGLVCRACCWGLGDNSLGARAKWLLNSGCPIAIARWSSLTDLI